MVDALHPFRNAAAGLPETVSDAMPVARICADARWPGSVTTITAGELRALVAAHPDSATPSGDGAERATSGEIEGLVERLVNAARDYGEAREQGDDEVIAIARGYLDLARTALLSHISTAGRGEGAAPDWLVEFVRAAANTVAQTTLPGSALREVAERAFAWAVIEGQALSAADATNPQDQE